MVCQVSYPCGPHESHRWCAMLPVPLSPAVRRPRAAPFHFSTTSGGCHAMYPRISCASERLGSIRTPAGSRLGRGWSGSDPRRVRVVSARRAAGAIASHCAHTPVPLGIATHLERWADRHGVGQVGSVASDRGIAVARMRCVPPLPTPFSATHPAIDRIAITT